MKKYFTLLVIALFSTVGLMAQGWPSGYGGVVLQGFFWDSFRPAAGHTNQTMATMYGAGWGENDEWYLPVTTWAELLNQKDNIAPYIDLLWLPQSGATVCSDQSVFTTEGEAWRAGHNGSWVVTH
jgi:alpha-amylase